MTSPRPVLLVTLVLSFCSLNPAFGQTRATTADLAGMVLDQSQAVLPGVSIVVTNKDTNARRNGITDRDGRYLIPGLPPGPYDVTATLTGFTTRVRENVTLALGELITVDFTLAVAGVAEQVKVDAPGPLAETTRTSVSSVISQGQIASLPISGRDYISFAVITPGVTTDRTPAQGASATSGLTFAGQRARSNNITVDGLDNNDPSTNGVRATFSQEAVREFQVITSAFAAEFGKASGGVVNIVTKSGTNTPVGTAFYYGRNEHLNAKEHFEKFDPAGQAIDRDKAPYSLNQFGGTWGGPLEKDRTFSFVSFERADVSTNNFVTIDDTTVVTVLGQPVGTPADILRNAGFPVTTGNVPYVVWSNAFLGKLDHRVRLADNIGVRYNWANGINENIEPWGGQVARSRGALLDNTDNMLAVSYTSVIGPRLLNELRLQIADRDQAVLALDPNCDGRCDGINEGGPTVEISGGASVGRQRLTPQPRSNRRYQIVESISHTQGAHYVKAGLDASHVGFRGALPAHFGGRYIFAPLPAVPGIVPTAVSAIQALALGLPAAYVQGYGTPTAEYTVSDLSLFAQDDWTLRSNLTLKIGVRYQKQFWGDRQYQARGITPFTIPSDNNNLAPRVAIAWTPRRDSRLSIHGSYGVFYDNQYTAGVQGVANILTGLSDGVRTQVTRFPASVTAWNAPGHQMPEGFAGPFPSLVFIPDPALETPFAHQVSGGVNAELPHALTLSANVLYVRGFNQVGTLDYNPIVPSLGAGRRPEDDIVNGVAVAGTSASVLEYATYGETWYRGLTVALEKRAGARLQFLASYTLSKAADNSTDFQSNFIPENTGRGRDPGNPTGLPIGLTLDDERGPSVQDQRHRLVLSGVYAAPKQVNVAAIITVGSGRPYNILAGADLNGDGDGGAFPADRARTNPIDPATHVSRNSGTLPAQATVDVRFSRRFPLGGRTSVDALVEMFNLFNRTNYTEINNVFGTGAYPTAPSPTYGQFQKSGPGRQMQVGIRLTF
jgi:Carboxypeptidase regulatory-like domain